MKQLLAVFLSLSLCGCAKTVVATISCTVGNHISVSKRDVLTEDTAKDIDANNQSRAAAGCTKNG